MTGGIFGFLAPDTAVLYLLGASGGMPVFGFGWWWTVLSAGWLHGSLLHIIFNMMWVRDLGPVVADMYGAGRMVIIYTVAGVSGFLLSSFAFAYLPHLPFLSGAGLTVGASASVFGFLGALVYYGRRTGSSLVRSEAIRYALILGFFGFVMRGVDNFAHAGGFFGGYLAARVLDPLKPERVDHIVIALICIVATFLAVAASVVTVLPILTVTVTKHEERETSNENKGRVRFQDPPSVCLYSFFVFLLPVTSAVSPARTAETHRRTSSR